MKSKPMIQSLKLLFYIAIGIQIAVFVSIAFKWINLMPYTANISVTVERYAILLTMICIPGALKLFTIIMKRNNHPEDASITNSFYVKAFIARFSILFLVATINILLFAFSFNQNFLLCTLATVTAYLFTYPSANYLKKHEA